MRERINESRFLEIIPIQLFLDPLLYLGSCFSAPTAWELAFLHVLDFAMLPRQAYLFGTVSLAPTSAIMLHKTLFYLSVICCGVLLCGCGTTKSRSGTEQLLVSDAVDRAVARIDFSPLSGSTVYLDTQYVKSVKGAGFVNADYIVSSLRQQMLAANCYLEEKKDTAEYVAEVRIGALGADAHNVTYGIPASNSLSTAAALVPNAPSIPMVPEISLAKKEDEVAAAKIVVFAYDRETRQAVWQSGIAQAKSTSKDLWLFGAGPFQSGSIHDVPQFAGESIDIPGLSQSSEEQRESLRAYGRDIRFVRPRAPLFKTTGKVLPASHENEVVPPKAKVPAKNASKPKEPPANPAAKVAAKPAAKPAAE